MLVLLQFVVKYTHHKYNMYSWNTGAYEEMPYDGLAILEKFSVCYDVCSDAVILWVSQYLYKMLKVPFVSSKLSVALWEN